MKTAGTQSLPFFSRLPDAYLLCQLLFGDVDKLAERRRVVHGDIGEHLAVDLDVCQLQPMNEPAIAEAIDAGGGIDARNPEAAKIAFLVAAVTVRIEQGFEHGFVGAPVEAMA